MAASRNRPSFPEIATATRREPSLSSTRRIEPAKPPTVIRAPGATHAGRSEVRRGAVAAVTARAGGPPCRVTTRPPITTTATPMTAPTRDTPRSSRRPDDFPARRDAAARRPRGERIGARRPAATAIRTATRRTPIEGFAAAVERPLTGFALKEQSSNADLRRMNGQRVFEQVIRTQAAAARPGFDVDAVLQGVVDEAQALTAAEAAVVVLRG